MQSSNNQLPPWDPSWYESQFPQGQQQQPPSQAQPPQWGNQTSWGNVQQPFPQGNQYPPQPQPQPPFPPQQAFPSQLGMPPYTQYPNYQPQPGQYPLYQPQPNWPMAPQFNPQLQMLAPAPLQPKKKHSPLFWILIVLGVIIVSSIFVGISQATNRSGSTNTASVTPAPTVSENAYKATTTTTTVDNLDKGGNQDKGEDVHFTCKVLNFVKDSSGNTAGANVETPNSYSISIIQIIFPSGTDLTQLNEGDTMEVWGTDEGVFSGRNAFGATVQEVEIAAQYMTDTTTNYQVP